MTRDVSGVFEQDGFILPEKVLYPTKIPVEHNQLRQLVSTPFKNTVYFAHKYTIYRIDTKTNSRAVVKQLAFSVRCTAAGHGWFCAGGDKEGFFAAVKLPDRGDDSPHQEWHYPTEQEHLGSTIVNGISIHKLELPGFGGRTRSETVAVVTNNDQYTRIYSLDRKREVWRSDDFGTPMNHASISPNGKLLIIVGDCSIAYIHQRVDFAPIETYEDGPESNRFPAWKLVRELDLHVPRSASITHYFTTAWSDTGRLFATASEHGYVMVLDVGKILDPEEDPFITIVPSSRPGTSPGAVRAICFAPAPWDLLLWTENYGRMCVADLRYGLRTRHVVSLDLFADDVKRHELGDRLLPRTVTDNIPDAADLERELAYVRAQSLSIRDQYAGPATIPQYHHRRYDRGLTEEETAMIDGLRATRMRQQAATNGNATSNQSRQTQSARGDLVTRANRAGASAQILNRIQRARNRIFAEDSDSDQPPRPLADDPWRTIERAMYRAAPGPYDHILEENDSIMIESTPRSRGWSPAAGRATLTSVRNDLSALEADRARRREQETEDASLTTRGLDARRRAALRFSSTTETTLSTVTVPVPQGSDLIQRHRSRRGQLNTEGDLDLMQLLDSPGPERLWRTSADGIVDGDPADFGVGTTGLALAADGRTVYVGTEKGIFELKMDYEPRKFWPANEFC